MRPGTQNRVAYEMVGQRVTVDGSLKTVARATCHRCGFTEDVTAPVTGHSPEKIAKQFRLKGWEFHAEHRNQCICPACLARRHGQVNDTDELLRKAEARMSSSITPIKPTVATDDAAAHARELTPKELRAAMAMLEQHFDDKLGTYHKGWNDRRLSEELNLPMACVTRVRRDAFGELKSTVEIEAIRREFQDLFQRVVDLEARINKLAGEGS